MGENTRIPPKVPEYQPSAPVKKADDIKIGKMGGEHEVTLLSIIKDIHIQGFLKTVQSLFEFIFPKTGSKMEAKENREYVITASRAEVEQSPILSISAPILASNDSKPSVLSLQEKVNQNQATYREIIDELKTRDLINQEEWRHLLIRPAPSFSRDTPLSIHLIRNTIQREIKNLQTISRQDMRATSKNVENFFDQLLNPISLEPKVKDPNFSTYHNIIKELEDKNVFNAVQADILTLAFKNDRNEIPLKEIKEKIEEAVRNRPPVEFSFWGIRGEETLPKLEKFWQERGQP